MKIQHLFLFLLLVVGCRKFYPNNQSKYFGKDATYYKLEQVKFISADTQPAYSFSHYQSISFFANMSFAQLELHFIDYNKSNFGVYLYKILPNKSFLGTSKIIGQFEIQKDTLILYKSLPIQYSDSFCMFMDTNLYKNNNTSNHEKEAHLDYLRNSGMFIFQIPTIKYNIRKEQILYTDCRDNYKNKRVTESFILMPVFQDTFPFILPSCKDFEDRIKLYSYADFVEKTKKFHSAKSRNKNQWTEDYYPLLFMDKEFPSLNDEFSNISNRWGLKNSVEKITPKKIYDFLLKYTKAT